MPFNQKEKTKMVNVIKTHIEPILYTDAILMTNEYLKEHGQKPLTMTQCRELRQNNLEKCSYDCINNALQNGENIADTYSKDIAYNVDMMFDKKDEKGNIIPGVLDSYLREKNIMPSNLKEGDTLAEYARTHEYDAEFLNNKFNALEYPVTANNDKSPLKYYKYVDLFGKRGARVGNDWKPVDISVFDAVQTFINYDPKKQKDFLQLSDEERKNFKPYNLSRNDMFVSKYDMNNIYHIHHNPNPDNSEYRYTIVHDNEAGCIPYMSRNDRTGLSQFRPYMSSQDYDDFAAGMNNLAHVEEVSDNQIQSVKNGIAVLDELDKRGLHYIIQKDINEDQLKAVLKDQKVNFRIYDESNPEYVGRSYRAGIPTYYKTDLYRAGTMDRVMPNEQMCRDLVAYSLGEQPDSPYVGDNKQHKVGERGDINVRQGTKYVPLMKHTYKSGDLVYNGSYVSDTNTNAFYDIYEKNGKVVPLSIYSDKSSQANDKENLKFNSPEHAKKYLIEKMQTAQNNFSDMLFGPDFGKKNEDGDINYDMPETSDNKISAMQDSYFTYLQYDDAVLIDPDESDESFKKRVKEVKEASAEAQTIANSLFKETPEQKIEGVRSHFIGSSKVMFGDIGEDLPVVDAKPLGEVETGSDLVTEEDNPAADAKLLDEEIKETYKNVATENNPLTLNVANIVNYSDAEYDDIIKALQAAGTDANIQFVSEDGDFSMARVKEKMVTYNEDTSQSLLNNNELSPFMKHVTDTVKSSVEAKGCNVDDIRIDDNGIIKYDGQRDIGMTYADGDKSNTESITGYIGQIFEPDENGVIVTKFNGPDNHAMIPGYIATVTRQKDGENKSVEERTICKGYEQLLDEKIRLSIHDNFINQDFDSTLNTTELNGVYRHLYDTRFPKDYKAAFRSKGMGDDYMDALIKTMKGSVRYDSSYIEESTINAEMDARDKNIINDLNSDGYSITKRDMSCLADSDPGYFDSIATSTGTVQGISRYLVNGAYVDESGHLQPARKEDGTICENAKTPLLELEVFKNLDYSPFDRQQMIFSNAIKGYAIEDNVGTAHMTMGGWTMDDGKAISKEWAERHFVPCNDINITKNLDPKLIENKITDKAGNLNVFDIDDGTSHVVFMGRDYDVTSIYQTLNDDNNTKTESELCSEFIKQKLIDDNLAMRPLQVGDKICDTCGGNKGVITLIVDRNMPDDVAKQHNLEKEVAIFRNNPDLDVVSAPFMAPSRMNAGTTRNMMRNPKDLVLHDGTVVSGGLGYDGYIITDKTVDEKTHIYEDGEGRRASSQLAWSLQSAGADKLLKYCYGPNINNLRTVRERMVALGMDLDPDSNENYKIVKGFHFQTDANGNKEHRDIIDIPEPDISIKGDVRKRTYIDKNTPLTDVKHQLQTKGGFMKLPFPLTLASGVETSQDEDGQYLLPVLPPEYRSQQSYDDNTSILHDYTRSYINIAKQAINYNANKQIIDEMENYDPENPSDKVYIPKNSTPEIKKKTCEEDLNKNIKAAQIAYNGLADKMKELNFEGKYNQYKQELMARKLPNSATAVWTADPRLELNQVGMGRNMADKLGVSDGDPVGIFRDPQLRKEGIAFFVAKIRDLEDTPITGITINPAMDSRFDGDFDGDSVGVISLNTDKYEDAVNNATRSVDYWQGEYNKTNNESVLEKFKQAKGHLFKAEAELNFMNEVKDEAYKLLGVENTLTDAGMTLDCPKERDDIKFAINTGLDIASASAVMRDKNPDNEILNAPDLAKDAIIAGDNKKAYELMNSYVRECLDSAYGSDIVRYGSNEDYYDSQNIMIVDHKAKGKIEKMTENAKYQGVDISYIDEEGNKVGMNDLTAQQKKDKANGISHVYKVDTSEGAIIDHGVASIRINTEDNTLTQEVHDEIKARKEEIMDMFRQVEHATAIKSFGTGMAGKYSQNGVKVCGEYAMCDALELTYGASQGLLQAKHDAVEADQKYTIIRKTLPALWKGNQIEELEDGTWVPKIDEHGEPVTADKEQFIDQYYNLCTSKTGLNFDITKERVSNVANVLHSHYIDSYGKESTFRNVYSNECGCTMDKLAYGGTFEDLVASAGKNMFDGRCNVFKPYGYLVDNKKRSFVSDYYNQDSMVYSKNAVIESKLERAVDVESNNIESERLANVIEGKVVNKATRKPSNAKSKTAVIIGSRPNKLYGYSDKDDALSKYEAMQDKIREKIGSMYDDGYKNFATTGVQGFNMLVFDAVEDLKQTHPEVKNIIITPSSNVGRNWSNAEGQIFSENRFKANLDKADVVYDVSTDGKAADYKAMDKMVSKCDTIVAMYAEGDDSWKMSADERKRARLSPSITANTIKVAKNAGSNIIMLNAPEDTNAYKLMHKMHNEEVIRQAVTENDKCVENSGLDKDDKDDGTGMEDGTGK